jgi:hypothetical protein
LLVELAFIKLTFFYSFAITVLFNLLFINICD